MLNPRYFLAVCALLLAGCPTTADDGPTEEPVLTDPPILTHEAVTDGLAGQDIDILVHVRDDDLIGAVTLFYRITDSDFWDTQFLQAVPDSDPDPTDTFNEADYTGVIPGSDVTAAGIEYYIKASDLGTPRGESFAPETAPEEFYAVNVIQFGAVLPWSSGFEAGSFFDEDFTRVAQGFLDNNWRVTDADANSGQYAALHSEGIQGTPIADDWLITPPLDFSGLGNVGVRWMEKGLYTEEANHELWASVRGPDPTQFERVAVLAPPQADWASSRVISLDRFAGQPLVWVAWRWNNEWPADRWLVDDIRVEERVPEAELISLLAAPRDFGPGDGTQLSFKVQAVSDLDLPALTATLETVDPLITIDTPQVAVPVIPAGTSLVLDPFAITVDPLHGDNQLLGFTLVLSDGAGFELRFPSEILMGEPSFAMAELSPGFGSMGTVTFGMGPVSNPGFSQSLSYGTSTAMPLTVELTDNAHLLPPGPGAGRAWIQVSNSGSSGLVFIDSFSVDFGGTVYDATIVDSTVGPGEIVTVFLPEPPNPRIDGLDVQPQPVTPGSSATIAVDLRNDGSDTAGPVSVLLSSNDPDVSITDPGPLAYGPMTGGQVVAAPGAFGFDVAAGHTNNAPVELILTVDDTFDSWELPVLVPVPWAVLEIDSILVSDAAGNGDGAADEGETVELTFVVINNGDAPSAGPANLSISLGSSMATVNLTGNTAATAGAGGLNPGETAVADATVPLEVLAGYTGDLVDFVVDISDGVSNWQAGAQLEITPLPWIPMPDEPAGTDFAGDNYDYFWDLHLGWYKTDGRVLWLRYETWGPNDPFQVLGTVLIYELPTWYEVQILNGGSRIFMWDPTNTSAGNIQTVIPLIGSVDETGFEVRVGLVDIGDPRNRTRVCGTVGAHCFPQNQYRCDVFPDNCVRGFSLDSGAMHVVTW